MKHTALVLIALISSLPGFSQNPNLEYNMAIKISNMLSYRAYSEFRTDVTGDMKKYSEMDWQILHPTFAVQWANKKKNLHEIELTNYDLSSDEYKIELSDSSFSQTTGQLISGSNVVRSNLAFRYEYIINLFKSNQKKWVPSVGFGFSPFFTTIHIKPLVSSEFPSSQLNVGGRFYATPRLAYYFSPEWFVDVNIPICAAECYYSNERNENPQIPIENRQTSSFNFSSFPKVFSMRMGIGLKI